MLIDDAACAVIRMQEDGSWQFDYRACELEVSFQLGGGGEGLVPPSKRKSSLLLLLTTRVWSFHRCVQTHEVFLKDSAGQTSECYSISRRLGSFGAHSTDVDDMHRHLCLLSLLIFFSSSFSYSQFVQSDQTIVALVWQI